MGFNCLISHKGIMLLMLPLTCKGFNSLLLMYINTLWLDAYCIAGFVCEVLICANYAGYYRLAEINSIRINHIYLPVKPYIKGIKYTI